MLRIAWCSVRHDWRRYLPVVVSIGVSGLLMIMQLSFMLGAFRSNVAPIRMSPETMWAGPVETTSFDSFTSFDASRRSLLWLVPEIDDIELYAPVFSYLALPAKPGESSWGTEKFILLVGIDTTPDALLFSNVLSVKTREALAEPGTVILDEATAAGLGVGVGDRVTIDSQKVRIVGLVPGLRNFMASMVIASHATARLVQVSADSNETFFAILRLNIDIGSPEATNLLNKYSGHRSLKLWTSSELISSTLVEWAFRSVFGVIFLSSVGIALFVTIFVVSQSLSGAVAASMREYAALRAYGLSFGRLQKLVMAQAAIVGAAALIVTAAVSSASVIYLRSKNVAVVLTPATVFWSTVILMIVVFLSNSLALRRLRKADPAALLR